MRVRRASLIAGFALTTPLKCGRAIGSHHLVCRLNGGELLDRLEKAETSISSPNRDLCPAQNESHLLNSASSLLVTSRRSSMLWKRRRVPRTLLDRVPCDLEDFVGRHFPSGPRRDAARRLWRFIEGFAIDLSGLHPDDDLATLLVLPVWTDSIPFSYLRHCVGICSSSS